MAIDMSNNVKNLVFEFRYAIERATEEVSKFLTLAKDAAAAEATRFAQDREKKEAEFKANRETFEKEYATWKTDKRLSEL